jgi:glycosyltransferase involved in cell wall biosynthesis
MACGLDGRSFIPNVSGLGRAFIQPGPVTFIVRRMYRTLLRRGYRVIFQNGEDLELFVRQGLVPRALAERVPGSGVDLAWFDSSPAQNALGGGAGGQVFLMVSRAMWDKGLGEYVEAARAIRRQHPGARFQLLGPANVSNPAAVPQDTLHGWIQEGVIEYLGATDDVRPYLRDADCVVLPSYREGVPRVLLEASAMARPVITTDAPGCRDAVIDGETGFMCRVRDGVDLAAAMRRFLALSPEGRRAMGRSGRAFVEANYDERIVIDRYLALVEEIGAKMRG